VPMLFHKGTRDAFADIVFMDATSKGLGQCTRPVQIDDDDHSFHIELRSGRTESRALTLILGAIAAWISTQAQAGRETGKGPWRPDTEQPTRARINT
jgi:uncharacterized protein